MRRIFPLLLALALTAAGTLLLVEHKRAARAEHTLQETYLSALSESAELMDRLSLTLEKLLLSQDAAMSAELLGQVSRDAGDVRRAMAFLPAQPEEIAWAMALTEHLSADASAVLPMLVEQGQLDKTARTELAAYQADCHLLAGQLATARQEALQNPDAFVRFAAPSTSDQPPVTSKQPSQLPALEITAAQAMTIAGEFVGLDRVMEVSGAPDVTGSLPAWGVSVRTDDLLLNLEITRQGGKVLMMTPETAGFEIIHTTADCVRAAGDFLASRDFARAEAVWAEHYDGLCVITFVPVMDSVLLYPDRLTVQVRMDTAQVVGLEARHYWLNHRPRRLPDPALSAEEASACLSPAVTEQGSRLCLIPSKGKETLCWAFTVVRDEETYLICLDAQTGKEIALQKMVPLENGQTAA